MFGNNENMKQFERIRTLKLNLNPKLNYHNQRVRKNHSLISLKIIEYNSNKFSQYEFWQCNSKKNYN